MISLLDFSGSVDDDQKQKETLRDKPRRQVQRDISTKVLQGLGLKIPEEIEEERDCEKPGEEIDKKFLQASVVDRNRGLSGHGDFQELSNLRTSFVLYMIKGHPSLQSMQSYQMSPFLSLS